MNLFFKILLLLGAIFLFDKLLDKFETRDKLIRRIDTLSVQFSSFKTAANETVQKYKDSYDSLAELHKDYQKDVNHLLSQSSTMEYSTWKQKVILLLSSLPEASLALKDSKNLLVEKIEELKQEGLISISNSRNITEMIKIKTRVKIDNSFSTAFLDVSLYNFFEKRTSDGTTFSSVHGVKGESFDATLLMVESNRGNTITPSLLNVGGLDCELMRIAYVAMTRPRKLLVVSIPKQKATINFDRFSPELWDYQEI